MTNLDFCNGMQGSQLLSFDVALANWNSLVSIA